MDEDAVDVRSDAPTGDAVLVVDGVRVSAFRVVVDRLRAAYPAQDPHHVEAVVLREWEAFSAGLPLVVPAAVEDGAREILDQSLR